jgi:hypothetical protein
MPWWKTIAREPLAHFVAIGAVLFGLDQWRSSPEVEPAPTPVTSPAPPPPAATRAIVIDDAIRTQIAADAERRLGRAPTPAELDEQTERWIDEEVLYRAAVERGLDRDDPIVHQRIAGRMAYVLEQAASIPEPSEAELRAWFDANAARWTKAEHVDFTHVFVADGNAARADEFARALASGAPPERLGDRFSGGHRFRGRKIADLALAFGDEFTDGLAKQPIGTWARRPSKHGIHLVRVDRVDAARPADFATARLDVRKEWMDARRAGAVRAAMQKLRETWTIQK